MTSLRPRQQEILRFIDQFIEDRGFPPTVRDIQYGCGISSTSVVDYNLRALTKTGHLRRSKDVSRGIELVGRTHRTTRIPLLGSIAAGEPLPVFPADPSALDEEDTIEVNADLAFRPAGEGRFHDRRVDPRWRRRHPRGARNRNGGRHGGGLARG